MQLTGRENVFLNGAILGYSRKTMQERYAEIVDFSELGEFIEVPVKNYSSGMIARLGFSCATSVRPDILIVDEILGVGDKRFQDKCQKRMGEIMGAGTTVILVSHSESAVRKICAKAAWLDHGRLMFIGDTAEAIERYNARTD
jgi:ABC-type polysaccharide/polyol phosphate transport system ATPase subunit